MLYNRMDTVIYHETQHTVQYYDTAQYNKYQASPYVECTVRSSIQPKV